MEPCADDADDNDTEDSDADDDAADTADKDYDGDKSTKLKHSVFE